jgi:hypothetical protein
VRFLTIVVVLLLAFAGAACGGGDDGTASDTDTVATDTTTTDDTTTDETTTDDDDGGSFAAGDCQELVTAYASLSEAFATTGAGDGDLEESQALLEEFAENAPDEIRADLEVLAEAYAEYVDVLADVDLQPGQVPDADTLQELQSVLTSIDQQEVTAAATRVSQWTTENC